MKDIFVEVVPVIDILEWSAKYSLREALADYAQRKRGSLIEVDEITLGAGPAFFVFYTLAESDVKP